LTVDEAAQLGDQLPMLVRGIYYEAWQPESRKRCDPREEFIAKVHAHLPKARPISPEDAVRAVFQVFEKHVTAGEIGDVLQALPQDIRALWPRPQGVL
jgi:uncharacterized protein (DUF2267 family)